MPANTTKFRMAERQVVHLDGLVVLKIIKHCTESLPNLQSGSLLGLDDERSNKVIMEVTNCFPFLPTSTKEGAGELEGREYQVEMMKLLREVNIDNNCVGWYQSSYLGSFCNSALIETQFRYQENLGPNMVVLIFDPLQTSNGSLSLRAFRLSDTFVDVYKRGQFTSESFAQMDIQSENILEEIPIHIHNSHLVGALLTDFDSQAQVSEPIKTIDSEFERLDLSVNPYLEKNLEYLCLFVDDIIQEHNKVRDHERQLAKQRTQQAKWFQDRKAENEQRIIDGKEALPEEADPSLPIFKPLQEPSRLETLLLSNQINTFCNQINVASGQGFTKLFVAGSLHKDAE